MSGMGRFGSRNRRSGFGRALRFLATFALLSSVAFAAAWLNAYSTVALSGQARIIDGDSLMVQGREIRLQSIDAPEFNQVCQRSGRDYSCGRESRDFLERAVRGRDIACNGSEEDRYRRLLAICMVGDEEVNALMVKAGWAVSYGGYLEEEAAAARAGAGLWAGTFDRPREWRARRGEPVDIDAVNVVRRLVNFAKRLLGLAL
jgi:endonuclease YncB( thermonuclease family)